MSDSSIWRSVGERRAILAIILVPVFLLAVYLLRNDPGSEGRAAGTPQPASLQIAITVDDLPRSGPVRDLARIQVMNRAMIDGFSSSGIRAVGFVNEEKLGVQGEEEAREQILRDWISSGQELGNHTYSHPDLNQTPLLGFKQAVLKGEGFTRPLLEDSGGTLRWFRHPFLRTGESLDKRKEFEGWLTERSYRVAPVTIENSDWMYNVMYTRAKDVGDTGEMDRIADAYLAYTDSMAAFCESTALALFGRPIRQVLLLHMNELNADRIDDLLDLLRGRGYRFVDLETALQDPVYARGDVYSGPAGVSWLFRWDHSSDRIIDWRTEPVPPAWVQAYDDYRP